MINNNNIDISVIIPIYNAEKNLHVCIDSLMHQNDLRLEIILVNDGSTDRSSVIADQYAKRYSHVKVIHQENRGTSAARNSGLELAKGKYVAFLDNDDWVKDCSLTKLYNEATKHQADVVMGNIWFYKHDRIDDGPFAPIPNEIYNVPFSGKECFIRLMKARAFRPMPWNYIYRRLYLEKIQARFEKGTTHEDELWTPVVICQAEKMIIVDIYFYYYRQWEGSVTHSGNLNLRLDAFFRVIDGLFEFVDRFDFSGVDGEFKNWWYVNIFRIYCRAFGILLKFKNSSFILPKLRLDSFWKNSWEMMPEPHKACKNYYRKAETALKAYTDWRISDMVASVAFQVKEGKKLMLIYNTKYANELTLKVDSVPGNWVITTDRRYLQQADVVVFYIPGLYQELDNDIEKPEGQIWVSWYLESEKNNSWTEDPEIRDIFDFWIGYRQDEEQNEHPLVGLCRKMEESHYLKQSYCIV